MTTTTKTTSKPHLVIFPLPLQGPVNCMLKLAELILTHTHPHLLLTFITTDFIHHHLAHNSHALARLARFSPRLRFHVVPVGLGEKNLPGPGQIGDLAMQLETMARTHGTGLREVLEHGSGLGPVTCVVADGFYGFMVDVAKDIGVSLIYFETVSPCSLWTYLCVPNMLRGGELPFQGDDLDEKITSIPGMEDQLRRRDLPSFYRTYDPTNNLIQLILKQSENFPKAQGQILNTFDDLERPLLTHFRSVCPNLYTVGPLHLHYRNRIRYQTDTSTVSGSNSLLQEDERCLKWLDGQPPKSVLFVSIGSLAVMTVDQLVEFWHGILGSGTRFLWVRRPGSVVGLNGAETGGLDVPKEILESTGGPVCGAGSEEVGYLVRWVPQEKVLAHPSIGGFLTHSGWNSTLESIVEGVPMICWPFFVDQQVNSRFADHVWKVGQDMKDSCDRAVIQEMVRDLMGGRGDELARNARELGQLAARAVDEDGSSYCQLNRLIDDIRFMRLSIPSHDS